MFLKALSSLKGLSWFYFCYLFGFFFFLIYSSLCANGFEMVYNNKNSEMAEDWWYIKSQLKIEIRAAQREGLACRHVGLGGFCESEIGAWASWGPKWKGRCIWRMALIPGRRECVGPSDWSIPCSMFDVSTLRITCVSRWFPRRRTVVKVLYLNNGSESLSGVPQCTNMSTSVICLCFSLPRSAFFWIDGSFFFPPLLVWKLFILSQLV